MASPMSGTAGVARIDSVDERVDPGLHGRAASERERLLQAIALPVDPGQVLADEHPGVAVPLGHLGKCRLVEREVQVDLDVEEVLGAPRHRVAAGRCLPAAPATVMELRREHDRHAWDEARPPTARRAAPETRAWSTCMTISARSPIQCTIIGSSTPRRPRGRHPSSRSRRERPDRPPPRRSPRR